MYWYTIPALIEKALTESRFSQSTNAVSSGDSSYNLICNYLLPRKASEWERNHAKNNFRDETYDCGLIRFSLF